MNRKISDLMLAAALASSRSDGAATSNSAPHRHLGRRRKLRLSRQTGAQSADQIDAEYAHASNWA